MLTKEQVDKVSETLYSRYFRNGSNFCLKSPLSVEAKKNLDTAVIRVVECLELNNFKITQEVENGHAASFQQQHSKYGT